MRPVGTTVPGVHGLGRRVLSLAALMLCAACHAAAAPGGDDGPGIPREQPTRWSRNGVAAAAQRRIGSRRGRRCQAGIPSSPPPTPPTPPPPPPPPPPLPPPQSTSSPPPASSSPPPASSSDSTATQDPAPGAASAITCDKCPAEQYMLTACTVRQSRECAFCRCALVQSAVSREQGKQRERERERGRAAHGGRRGIGQGQESRDYRSWVRLLHSV